MIVVIPGQFRSPPHPAGKLASTLLSVAVAGTADPARFRRGKAYSAEHAVTRLEVSVGQLVALVQGSRATPYQVIIAVPTVARPPIGSPDALRSHLNELAPDGSELLCSCSCPDFDDPCKHAVAALLTLAKELEGRPELLLEWRTFPDGSERPTMGSRARAGARPGEPHLRPVGQPNPSNPRTPAARPVTPWHSDAWREFLGTPPPPPPRVPDETAPVGQAMFGAVDLSAWLRSALDTLTGDVAP